VTQLLGFERLRAILTSSAAPAEVFLKWFYLVGFLTKFNSHFVAPVIIERFKILCFEELYWPLTKY
jgi:hypothetical protein